MPCSAVSLCQKVAEGWNIRIALLEEKSGRIYMKENNLLGDDFPQAV